MKKLIFNPNQEKCLHHKNIKNDGWELTIAPYKKSSKFFGWVLFVVGILILCAGAFFGFAKGESTVIVFIPIILGISFVLCYLGLRILRRIDND